MATSAELAQEAKAKGNASFQAGNFTAAVEHFTKAIELSPSDAVLYSNRSGAYASLKQFENALKDAEMCVQLKPDWAKVGPEPTCIYPCFSTSDIHCVFEYLLEAHITCLTRILYFTSCVWSLLTHFSEGSFSSLVVARNSRLGSILRFRSHL